MKDPSAEGHFYLLKAQLAEFEGAKGYPQAVRGCVAGGERGKAESFETFCLHLTPIPKIPWRWSQISSEAQKRHGLMGTHAF